MLKLIQGSFLEGCGVVVRNVETDGIYHLLVHKEKATGKLFVEIDEKKFYKEDMQTVKEFLKGTRNNYHVNITQGNNDNVVFNGTYTELKENKKDLLTENVTSWDAVPMANGTTDIGIMI